MMILIIRKNSTSKKEENSFGHTNYQIKGSKTILGAKYGNGKNISDRSLG